ncbi:MAG: hypothetical protein ACJAVI_003576 [Candidatus Azotimanducaceae bacterium]|jgi:hypothetical protein
MKSTKPAQVLEGLFLSTNFEHNQAALNSSLGSRNGVNAHFINRRLMIAAKNTA